MGIEVECEALFNVHTVFGDIRKKPNLCAVLGGGDGVGEGCVLLAVDFRNVAAFLDAVGAVSVLNQFYSAREEVLYGIFLKGDRRGGLNGEY